MRIYIVFDHKLPENKRRLDMIGSMPWVRPITLGLTNGGDDDGPCCGDRQMGLVGGE